MHCSCSTTCRSRLRGALSFCSPDGLYAKHGVSVATTKIPQIVSVQVTEAQRLCEWVLGLLRVYSRHNLGRTSVAAARALTEVTPEHFRATLGLLCVQSSVMQNTDCLICRVSSCR